MCVYIVILVNIVLVNPIEINKFTIISPVQLRINTITSPAIVVISPSVTQIIRLVYLETLVLGRGTRSGATELKVVRPDRQGSC